MPLAPLLNNRLFQIVFLAYSSLLIFLGRHGGMGISNYDDAFYAQKAKEMLESGSLWIVNYHGQPSFENSPLPFWVMALVFKLFGISDYTVALPSALFGAATVLVTYRFAEHLFKDRLAAFLAGAILILPGFFVDYARRGMVDIPLTFLVAAALFCFVKADGNPRWHLLFGVFTALAVLTKSVLGFFPLVIAFAYSLMARPGFPLAGRGFYFWAGVTIALVLGSSWYFINVLQLGKWFIQSHFGWLLFRRAIGEEMAGVVPKSDPFFFTGYLRALLGNYWPWLPFAAAGMVLFGKRAVRDGDNRCLFIIIWITVIIGVMSISRAQVLRYILSAFPALAILTAKTISDWIPEKRKDTLIPYMTGMVMLFVLFVNASAIEFSRSVSFSQNSVSVRYLAPVIRLNTSDNVGNYRLTAWNPRNAVIFYSDRFLSEPVQDAEELMRRLAESTTSTWLTTADEFEKLKEAFPGKFYLIEAYEKYAYFTAEQNKENIRYDLPKVE